MTSNTVARIDSTLLSLIGQAKARGARKQVVEEYFNQLHLDSSKRRALAILEEEPVDTSLQSIVEEYRNAVAL